MVSRLPDSGSFPLPNEPEALLYREVLSRIGELNFETWFQGAPCRFVRPNQFVIVAPNRFKKAWLDRN
jgi:chromosomal replication initiation ATPase DnaA